MKNCKKSAIIEGNYRYELKRLWDDTKPFACFVGCNPSTADAEKDDATIRNLYSLCEYHGFGGFVMVNLYAYRSTNPEFLHIIDNPIGPKNDYYIRKAFAQSNKVIFMWGNIGAFGNRDNDVKSMIREAYCISETKMGNPRHVLRSDFKNSLVRYK